MLIKKEGKPAGRVDARRMKPFQTLLIGQIHSLNGRVAH